MSRTVNCTEEIVVVSDGEKDTGKLAALWGTGKFHPSVIPAIDELQDQITKEVSARTKADEQLQTNLEAEVNTRVVADQNLQEQISKEIAARTDGDTALQSSVDKEVVERTDADSKLQSSIDVEADARGKADQSLQEQLAAEIAARSNTDEAETNARINADKNLQEQIDVLEGKNAFSHVVVNSTTIEADSQTDTIELEAGTNIALTADTAKEKVTIAVTGKVASAAQADSAAECTGNAASATKFETARTINGVSFDGSKDITIPASSTYDSVHSFTSNGYQKLNNGLIFQWGKAQIPAGANVGSVNVTFPIQFSNACLSITTSYDNIPRNDRACMSTGVSNLTNSGCSLFGDAIDHPITNTVNIYYIAIGY